MRLRLEDRNKAIQLRRQGKTYGEILNLIPNLSKSTLSGWLKKITLTGEEEVILKNHLIKVVSNAKAKSILVKRNEKRQRIQKIQKLAREDYIRLSKNPFFWVGLALYWAEGNKKTQYFQFTNSDPFAIKAMLKWIKMCGMPRKEVQIRIYIHKIYADENCEKFWSNVTGIPVTNFQKTIYKPTIHKVKKNIDYKGCVQIRILRSAIYWRVMQWLQSLIKSYRLN